jgi:hypothetical protein
MILLVCVKRPWTYLFVKKPSKTLPNGIFKIFVDDYFHPCWKHPALRKTWAEPCEDISCIITGRLTYRPTSDFVVTINDKVCVEKTTRSALHFSDCPWMFFETPCDWNWISTPHIKAAPLPRETFVDGIPLAELIQSFHVHSAMAMRPSEPIVTWCMASHQFISNDAFIKNEK